MEKTDKELAVELACAYISAWASRPEPITPISQEIMSKIVLEAYNAVHDLPRA